MRFQVLTAVIRKFTALCNVTPCNLVKCIEILEENRKRDISSMLHAVTPQKAVIYSIQSKLTAVTADPYYIINPLIYS